MKRLLPCLFSSLAASVVAQTPPKAPLEWGDLNFIHTSDTHGWLLGHSKSSAPEPNYSATLGDLASFVQHMNDTANAHNVDLLLIDSGDQHDGNGITDGQPPDLQLPLGHVATSYFKKLNYTLLTLGNHELGDYAVTKDVYTDFAPYWGDRYLSSNVDIKINGEFKSVGSRWTSFVTPNKKFKITSFSLMVAYVDKLNLVRVLPVSEMFEQQWFKDAMAVAPDAFVLLGHNSIQDKDWDAVYNKVRESHKDVPIFIFGGHTHNRDCRLLNKAGTPKRTMAIESGKYLETVGWLSTRLGSAKSTDDLWISRRYLDGNRVTFKYHTGEKTNAAFDTPEGLMITQNLRSLTKRWDLSTIMGHVPQDYYLDRYPYGDKSHLDSNLLHFYATKIVPTALVGPWNRTTEKYLFLSNWGVCRYDMLAGPFVKGDQYAISPYPQAFRYSRVPWILAKRLQAELIAADSRQVVLSSTSPPHLYNGSDTWDVTADASIPVSQAVLGGRLPQVEPTLGWVTNDACGAKGSGDDTLHTPITQVNLDVTSPYMHYTNFGDEIKDTDEVDLITIDFLYKKIAQTLNRLIPTLLPTHPKYTEDYLAIPVYGDVLASQIIGKYVQMEWPKKP